MNEVAGGSPLDQLKDIHAPASVDIWPLAWGWWFIAAILLGCVLGLGIWLYRRRRFNAACRAAKQEVSELNADDPLWPSKLNTLLKRVVVFYYPTSSASALYGDHWRDFLLSCVPSATAAKLRSPLDSMQQSLYRPVQAKKADFPVCQKAAQTWLNKANLRKTPSASAGTGGARV